MLTLFTTYLKAQKRWRFGAPAALLCLVTAGVLAVPRGADAAIPLLIGIGAAAGLALSAQIAQDQMLSGVGWIVAVIVDALHGLFLNVVFLIVEVSRYTAFIDSIPVTRGWEIVRDVMNMFFVIVLLAIAVGTILQQEKYHYSKTLPKFIIAAILVNFSKTIAGIFIDFSNVVMLTFTGAIENTAGGNFLAITGIAEFQQYVAQPGTAAVGVWEVLASFIVLLAFDVIALIVVVVMLFILVFRIVALWFLVVLSPAAFFLAALPDDKGYAKKWWDQFVNYLIVGPVMLFFLWLSFTTLAASSQSATGVPQIGSTISSVSASTTSPIPNKLGTALGTPQTTLGFFLGIVMLLGSMAVAQQLGVEGGKMAGGVIQGAKDYAAGKKGPSPMRWARDRWGAYSKQREHDRQLKARMEVSAGMKLAGKAISLPGELAQQFIGTPLMTSKYGMALRNWWKDVPVFGTKARESAAERRSQHMGTSVDLRNEAGERKQEAQNMNNRAVSIESGDKHKLEERRDALQARIHELEADTKDPAKSLEERRKAEEEIDSLKLSVAEVDADIAAFEGTGALKKHSDYLGERARLLEESTGKGEETDDEKNERDARNKARQDQIAMFQSMINLEKLDPQFGKDTPEGKEIAARIARLEEQLEEEKGKIEAEPEKMSDEKKKQKLREAEILRADKELIDDAIRHEESGKGSARGKLADGLRGEAIKAEVAAEKLEVQAKGEDWKATADLARMEFPEFAAAVLRGGLAGLAGGPAIIAPFIGDFLKGSQNFGNRLTLEGQEVELEALQAAAKKFGNLRDEVVKAIANGTAKGFSNLEQMAAKTEMMRRNLYDPSEVEGGRRDFVRQGAGGAAVEAFDYEVYKQYPSQAFGMTPEKLVELVNKNRIDLSKLTRPESLNAGLLKAINRLPTAISAQLMMRMKSNPIVENRAREIAEEELNRMEIQGQHKERQDDGSVSPNRDYEQFIKVLGMNRGFPDDHLGIGMDGNFRKDVSAEDKTFYQQVIVNAMKDDDVAPYFLTGMHNKIFQNKDSDLARLLAEQLRQDGPNGAMAMHVMSAILRASKNGDRASANVAGLSGVLMHQIENRLGKDGALLDEIYQIIKWKKTRVG
ncbi:hypothetical protein HYV71_04005 [Candidatus Uhrbacteria bacterium]|nr:hypothetical protein [Candidatus Uhrbacteria bacterium]